MAARLHWRKVTGGSTAFVQIAGTDCEIFAWRTRYGWNASNNGYEGRGGLVGTIVVTYMPTRHRAAGCIVAAVKSLRSAPKEG